MPRVLSSHERRLLTLFLDEKTRTRFVPIEQVKGAVKLGRVTLQELVKLGLVGEGPVDKAAKKTGYRLNPDGFLAAYGVTFEEAADDGRQILPLQQMQWPPDARIQPRWVEPEKTTP